MKHTTYLQLTAEIQDLDSEEKLIAYLVATYDIARVLTNRLRRKQNCKSILTEKQISNIRDKNIDSREILEKEMLHKIPKVV